MEQAVDLVLRARDEASAVLNKASGGLGDMHAMIGKLASEGGALGGVAVGIVAIGTAAYAAGVKLADTYEQLSKLSATTGVGVESLQVYQETMSEMGADSEGLQSAFVKLNQAIAEGNPYLKQLGITTRDSQTAFQQLASALANGQDQGKKTEVAMKLLGKSSADFLAVLPELARNFDQMKTKMREAGALIGDDMAPALQKLDQQTDDLSRNWKGAMLRMQSAAVPTALAIARAFNEMWDSLTGQGAGLAATERHLQDVNEQIDRQRQEIEKIQAAATDSRYTPEIKTAVLDQFKSRLQDLLDTASQLRGAIANAGGGGPVGPAWLGGASTDDVTIGASDSRAKRLDDLQKTLQVGRAAAVAYAAALDEVERAKKRDATLKDLQSAGVDAGALATSGAMTFTEAFGAQKPRKAAGLKPSGLASESGDYQKNLAEILRSAPRASEAVTDLAMRWSGMVEEMTSATGMLDSGLNAVWGALDSGLSTVFERLTDKTQTFKSAISTIFSSLVSSILAELGRLAAAWAFKMLLNFVPGVGSVLSVGGGGTIMQKIAGGAKSSSPGGITVNVSSLDTRGATQAFTSPRGGVREALRDMQLARAF